MTISAPDRLGGSGSTLAEKLRLLRDLNRRDDGGEYTHQEIADGVSALHRQARIEETRACLTSRGATRSEIDAAVHRIETEKRGLFTRSYVSQLLSGEGDNPTLEKITYLARFFSVPTGYFFDDEGAAQVGAQLEELRDLRDLLAAPDERETVLALARSTSKLPERSRKTILRAALQSAEEMHRLTQEGDN